jgi:hypothetical protein
VLCLAEHVTGRDLRDAEDVLEQAGLRALTRTRWPQQQDAHPTPYRRPRMRPRFMNPS